MATYAAMGSSGAVGPTVWMGYERRFPFGWIMAMSSVQFVVFAYLDFAYLDPQGLSRTWGAPSAVMVMVVALHHRFGARGPLVRWAVVAMTGLLFASALFVGGMSPLDAMSVALWDVAVALGMAAAIWVALGSKSWVPTQAKQVPLMLLACAGVAVPASYLGVLPGTELMDPGLTGLWYAIPTTYHAFIAGSGLFIIWWFPQDWRPLLKRDAIIQGAAFPVLAVLGWVLLYHPELQLTWLVLVPALGAGMTTSVTAAVVGCLGGAGIASLMPLALGVTPFGDSAIPGGILVNLLASAAAMLSLVIALYRWESGELTTWLQAERRQVATQAALLEGAFDSMHDAFLVLDSERRVVLANPAAHALFGKIPAEPILDWLPLREFSGAGGEDWRSLRELVAKRVPGTSSRHRGSLEVASGGIRHFEFDIVALDADSDLKTLVSIFDVTEELLRTNELRAFAGTVAHDLKSPLTKLDGWLEVLEDESRDVLNPTASRALASAQRGGHQLREMIDDWLSVTVAHNGELQSVPTDLSAVLDEVAVQLPAPLNELVVHTPHRVQADPVMLRQLMANLISNAVKYTDPHRSPEIHVWTNHADEGWVEISVRDNGIGIPPGEEQAIFDEGHRASDHAAHYAGTGRGLALCSRLVARHGGEIRAQRNLDGPGSTFVFTLPAAAELSVAS